MVLRLFLLALATQQERWRKRPSFGPASHKAIADNDDVMVTSGHVDHLEDLFQHQCHAIWLLKTFSTDYAKGCRIENGDQRQGGSGKVYNQDLPIG